MPLNSGTRLGPYEIVGPLGAGGMGEVYRARDPRIGREVAVKVLPSAWAENPERLRRFEQEARATGALNHPNILAIHDIGTENGAPYLVSELLEGETLRNKLEDSPLPLRKAIDYALQIAHGLAAAHEKGIVHRDLKPENVFITKDGRAKILDFGLAKLTHPEVAYQELSKLQTGAPESQPGFVVGTVGYMSPEQVRGRGSDHRSDIFAFGTILYEMLTRNRAFHGVSPADTMSAILQKEPPDLSQTNPNLPPAIDRIVRHCLEKNPEERFQSMQDVAFYLEALSGISGTSVTAPTLAPSRSRIWRWTHWVATAILAILMTVFAIGYFRRPAESPRVVRALILPPENTSLEPFSELGMSLSPDGRYIAFVTWTEGKKLLWLRALDAASAQPMPGTEGATYPFWSPDSRFIGFFAKGKLKKMEATGAPPQVLCDVPNGRGGTWNREGVILFAPSPVDVLYQVSSGGGPAKPVRTPDPKAKEEQRWPVFLPDGKHFLFTKNVPHEVWLAELGTNETRLLISNCSNAVYVPPGYLVFVRNGTLMAVMFDAGKLRFQGEAFPITSQRVSYYLGKTYGGFSVSDNGVLSYIVDARVPSELKWVNRDGQVTDTLSEKGYYLSPRLSPDGREIAVVRVDPETAQSDLWIYETARQNLKRFTFQPAVYWCPLWSSDGTRIFYSGDVTGSNGIYVKASNGNGSETRLLSSEFFMRANDCSLDGRYLAYQKLSASKDGDIWILPLFGDRKPFLFLQTPFYEWDAHFSPDARWMAYTSDESGKREVYVQPFPEGSGKWQISTAGGIYPRWRQDGKELFYVSPDGKLMSVEIKTATTFDAGLPKPLFQLPERAAYVESDDVTIYDVSQDGQSFLINPPVEKQKPSSMTLVLNWTAGLKR